MGQSASAKKERMPEPASETTTRTVTRSTNANRPSDEDIINFENQIREEQIKTQPLMSPRLPISVLLDEYASSPNSNFLSKILQLQEEYAALRKSRGDGNCFFRAFSFALVESIAAMNLAEREKETEWLKGTIGKDLQSAGFEKMAYEDFYEELFAIFSDPQLYINDSPGDYLADLWQAESHRSHALVVILRLVASAYLRGHAEEYEPFIWEAGLDMVSYCQRHVECLGVESDQIHAIALGKALRVNVQIAYLDGSDGPLSCINLPVLEPSSASNNSNNNLPPGSHPSPVTITITLLYRPGHYDLLYTK